MPSTAIRRIDYAPDSAAMEIVFVTGRRYLYFDVPAREVDAFRHASSKGRYFNAHIRDRYDFEELEPVA